MFVLTELVEIIVSSAVLTYIFSGLVPGRRSVWEDLKLSAAISVPSLVLHELAHKFSAMLLGYAATYHANLPGLAIGVVLKMVGFPFIFFVPAYVSIPSLPFNKWFFMIIALAGPAMNAFLIGLSYLLENKVKKRNHLLILYLTRKINTWLLILNLLPIPGTDGAHALRYLFS
jgi:Zn-dependent protease